MTANDDLRAERICNITVKQVKAFVTAVDAGNFTRAASNLHQTQPSFSRSIQDLEAAMGETLFLRTRQGVALTNAGANFLPHARKLLDSYLEALNSLSKQRAAHAVKLRLAANEAALGVIVPRLHHAMSHKFGQVELSVEEGSCAQIVQRVLAGTSDFGLCTLADAPPECERLTLLRAPLGILTSPQEELAPIGCLADMAGLTWVRHSADLSVAKALREQTEPFSDYLNAPIASSSLPGALSLVRSGGMATIVSGIAASHHLATDLQFVPLPELLPTLELHLICTPSHGESSHWQAMRHELAQAVLLANWHSSVEQVNEVSDLPR